jgi:hypothetical protein
MDPYGLTRTLSPPADDPARGADQSGPKADQRRTRGGPDHVRERRTHNRLVAGSSPAGPTKRSKTI